jgi:hypothetical protein
VILFEVLPKIFDKEYAMTATPSIDLPGWMAEQLSQASPDLLRQMVQTFRGSVDIGIGSGTPAPAASTWPSPSYGKRLISPSARLTKITNENLIDEEVTITAITA